MKVFFKLSLSPVKGQLPSKVISQQKSPIFIVQSATTGLVLLAHRKAFHDGAQK